MNVTPETKVALGSMAKSAAEFVDEIVEGLDNSPANAAMLMMSCLSVCLYRMGIPRDKLENMTLLEIGVMLFNEMLPGEFTDTVQ